MKFFANHFFPAFRYFSAEKKMRWNGRIKFTRLKLITTVNCDESTDETTEFILTDLILHKAQLSSNVYAKVFAANYDLIAIEFKRN